MVEPWERCLVAYCFCSWTVIILSCNWPWTGFVFKSLCSTAVLEQYVVYNMAFFVCLWLTFLHCRKVLTFAQDVNLHQWYSKFMFFLEAVINIWFDSLRLDSKPITATGPIQEIPSIVTLALWRCLHPVRFGISTSLVVKLHSSDPGSCFFLPHSHIDCWHSLHKHTNSPCHT